MASINYSGGQFSLTQMLSEESHSQALIEWLTRWRIMGAPKPNKCTSDWARSILNGVTRTYTRYQYIEQYADALKNEIEPEDTFIQIDVGHTMKTTRIFLMACIGELVKCTDFKDAEEFITNLLIVCLSEYEGDLPNGEKSLCEQAKDYLEGRVTGKKTNMFSL